MAEINTYSVTLSASLTNYPAVQAVTLTFTANLVDPCLTTSLTLPTTLVAFSITAYSGTGYS